MSGKDTQGLRLVEALKGHFLSSGEIIREMEAEILKSGAGTAHSAEGNLIPTDLFYEWVLPYFGKHHLSDSPLVLSSIGRWHGEEEKVMAHAHTAGHPMKAVVWLTISEDEAHRRWTAAKQLGDRGERPDDQHKAIFHKRIREFHEKTMPVLDYYDELDLLLRVNGENAHDDVFAEMIDALHDFTKRWRW